MILMLSGKNWLTSISCLKTHGSIGCMRNAISGKRLTLGDISVLGWKAQEYVKAFVNIWVGFHNINWNCVNLLMNMTRQLMKSGGMRGRLNMIPPVCGLLSAPHEKYAAEVFTMESYKSFLSEMWLETHLFVLNIDEGSNFRKYMLGNSEHQSLACEVMFKPSSPSIKCSCLEFETTGFPCCHAIHIINCERLEKFPKTSYIQDGQNQQSLLHNFGSVTCLRCLMMLWREWCVLVMWCPVFQYHVTLRQHQTSYLTL